MPLVVLGARQVGKTYALDEFCKKNYKNYLYINLEKEEAVREVFDNYLEPKQIMNAISALKYFNEAKENYQIVCAGSMLGVVLNRFKYSFPAGKIYRLYMYHF